MKLPFIKMNGAGNDFVVFDGRRHAVRLSPAHLLDIADRKNALTKGCDQIIVMQPSQKADVFMRIYNADGSEVGSCGNASRCIGWLVHTELKKNPVTIETADGIITAHVKSQDHITIDMGEPRLEWQDIPLAGARDTLHVGIESGPLNDPVAVSMGNPHIIFFVQDADSIDLSLLGPALEHDKLFPKRVNISVAQVITPQRIALRVWERGAGLTLACGTAACATLVAAHRRGLSGKKADIVLPGGTLSIEWHDDNHVFMTGPAATDFIGELDLA